MNTEKNYYYSPECYVMVFAENGMICTSSDPDVGGIESIFYEEWD